VPCLHVRAGTFFGLILGPTGLTHASVFTKAEARGLSAKWRRGDGWRLVDASGETVAGGNMRELSEHLDAA
jgi:hypothetical protein